VETRIERRAVVQRSAVSAGQMSILTNAPGLTSSETRTGLRAQSCSDAGLAGTAGRGEAEGAQPWR